MRGSDSLHRWSQPLGTLFPAVPSVTRRGDLGLVDIWSLRYTVEEIADLVRLWSQRLPPEERARARRFHFSKDRSQYIAARALIRTALSRYAAPRPSDWRFTSGPFGRPTISIPLVKPSIYFNLSHTDGLIVCAVSVAHEAVGIDVERRDRACMCMELSDVAFSQDELCVLEGLPHHERALECLVRWTLKESYAKAIGIGLRASFDRMSFELTGSDIRLPVATRESERSVSGWRFALYDIDCVGQIALAVHTNGAPLVVHTTPLRPDDCLPSDCRAPHV